MKVSRAVPAIVAVAILLLAWEGYARAAGLPAVVLPPPSRVVSALWEFRLDAIRHTMTTLLEAILGLAVSVAFGVATASAMDRISIVRRAIEPLLIGSQTIPIVAIAPLLVIWFGFGIEPKILVIVLVTFFPITISLLDGFAATPAAATDLLGSMGATDGQMFTKLRWPGALPSLFTGLRIAAAYAVVGAVFGEYVGAVTGLGIWMQISQNAFRTDLVLGAVFITAIMSVALFVAVGAAERLIIPWHRAPSSADGDRTASPPRPHPIPR
jgi:ABC-type nitrate/sulfonate/bicarbonate transport system permease component